ncbi:hypothetical protein BH10CYA1_BH10CYA1_64100 [soil metagenome]
MNTNERDTASGAPAKSANPLTAAKADVCETSYTPLDIADPDGRFGLWMPGDDPDDWR